MNFEEQRIRLLETRTEAHTSALMSICMKLRDLALETGSKDVAERVQELVNDLANLRRK